MKLKFDPNQQFQLDAVNAVVDIFEGQPADKDFQFAVQTKERMEGTGENYVYTGAANYLFLDNETVLSNVQAIQERNDIEKSKTLEGYAINENGQQSLCPNFSVEMETGTGKTYVYLRTIFELNKRYGYKKFIIVVPSVAIREGVVKNIQITSEHFKSLYDNPEFEYFEYDSKKKERLRNFAISNHIQVLIITIHAFNTEDNVINQEYDKMSGLRPIDFITATNPIVIVDEPQNMESEKAQKAITKLKPLCTLRYSATHRNPYNLLYRLDPVKAFELGLVKQINVASVMGENSFNQAYVKLLSVDNKNGIKARIQIHKQTKDGIKPAVITVKKGDDLYEKSGNRENYRDRFTVAEISWESGNEFITFGNGTYLALEQEIGGIADDIFKEQIEHTVKRHLEKAKQLRPKGIKVLSLFFIDKVANYRSYDSNGKPVKGKYALAFEEAYNKLAALPQFKDVLPYRAEEVHNGYFAQDKQGHWEDISKGDRGENSEKARAAYELIMREKEKLLDMNEPLRFIFSHSALREGWDNPNVFQICTLNETTSVVKKRQEIGRGLRLPVDSNGDRVFDENINKLLVIANESYHDFAAKLQKEYEEDCGFRFGVVPSHAFAKLRLFDDGEDRQIGQEKSGIILEKLIENGVLDKDGKITPTFSPDKPIALDLPEELQTLQSDIVSIVSKYHIEKHIKPDADKRPLVLKKEVFLDDDFKELWERIKHKTTYSVEYSTEELIRNAVNSIKKMPEIQPIIISYREGKLDVSEAGIDTQEVRVGSGKKYYSGNLPDILLYLQQKTELTRSTVVRILKESGRIDEFKINPQLFMDQVAAILKLELHKLMIDGIKYEKIADEWSMRLFEENEIVSYLNSRLEVNNSLYDAIVYDSGVEREFAAQLDKREDVKLFVKLPKWFKIDTPIGSYNPDWAILKVDGDVLYLVRETKDTKKFEELRIPEAEKIRCGRRHFETLSVDFDVVVKASEV